MCCELEIVLRADLHLSASIQEMMIQLKDCNDLLKQYWKESSFSLDEAHRVNSCSRVNRCCEGRITPLTVKALGMDIVNLIYLEMWLVATSL